MKKPWSTKSKPMREALENVFPEMAMNISQNKCATCGSDRVNYGDFADELSRKEHTISGMCQACQDRTFKLPDEDAGQKALDEHQKTCEDPECECRYF